MTQTIALTTARVAASPTAAALRPARSPARQPHIATRTPKTALFTIPIANVVSVIDSLISSAYCASVSPRTLIATMPPPTMPTKSA